MELSPIWKDTFLQILREELIPAMGCTEPIAIAYGAARAREVLGCLPEEVLVEASGNLIKNVKSVIVPNTNGLSGIEAAVAAGLSRRSGWRSSARSQTRKSSRSRPIWKRTVFRCGLRRAS